MREAHALDLMHTEARDALFDLVNRVAAGEDKELVMNALLRRLHERFEALRSHVGKERPPYMVDWENVGKIANHAWEKSMNTFAQTKDRNAACRVFNSTLRPILQPKLWW